MRARGTNACDLCGDKIVTSQEDYERVVTEHHMEAHCDQFCTCGYAVRVVPARDFVLSDLEREFLIETLKLRHDNLPGLESDRFCNRLIRRLEEE